MKSTSTSWLQLYVDAMTERDPYKRLALIRELRSVPRERELDDYPGVVLEEEPHRQRPQPRSRKTKSAPRR